MRRLVMRSLVIVGALLAFLAVPAGALAAAARTSLSDLEDEVMCVTCRIPLQIADSPEADRERAFIRGQIGQGKDKQQVKDALVAQYGERVLAVPGDKGVDLAAWLVPGAAILAALGGLALALLGVRRRRRAAGAGAHAPAAPALSPADTRRLDEDLARFDT
jgi:cytochrome c-type biogenesis protein CcmH/NrfF